MNKSTFITSNQPTWGRQNAKTILLLEQKINYEDGSKNTGQRMNVIKTLFVLMCIFLNLILNINLNNFKFIWFLVIQINFKQYLFKLKYEQHTNCFEYYTFGKELEITLMETRED